MNNEVNTSEKVKIFISLDEVDRLKKALPFGAIARIAQELNMKHPNVVYEFSRVSISDLSADRQSRLFSKDILEKAIEVVQETGNTSFDHLLEAC